MHALEVACERMLMRGHWRALAHKHPEQTRMRLPGVEMPTLYRTVARIELTGRLKGTQPALPRANR
jgi:hypothetical protein